MKILALDIGKDMTVACSLTGDTGHEFYTIETTREQLKELILSQKPDRVVFEICSAAGWVYDLVDNLGVEAQVSNPTHGSWRWKYAKRNVYENDALELAQLSRDDKIAVRQIGSRRARQKRSLANYRAMLIKRRAQVKNYIRTIIDREGIGVFVGKQNWTDDLLHKLTKLSKPLNECDKDELWRGELLIELVSMAHIDNQLREVEEKLKSIPEL